MSWLTFTTFYFLKFIAKYIQTYFYDVQQQNQQRMAAFPQQHQQRALPIVDKIWFFFGGK